MVLEYVAKFLAMYRGRQKTKQFPMLDFPTGPSYEDTTGPSYEDTGSVSMVWLILVLGLRKMVAWKPIWFI